jgi:hypothetical protein
MSNIVRLPPVVFVVNDFQLDVGQGFRPGSIGEWYAHLLFAELRGRTEPGGIQLGFELSPKSKLETRRHLQKLLKLPGRAPATYHHEWAKRFRELHSELCAGYAAYHVDGDTEPTSLGTAGLIAIEDYARHPERWRYDPETNLRAAERRVWGAVKPLV